MFPRNQFGTYILPRKRLLKNVFDKITSFRAADELTASQSIYLAGCMGMGKTCLLMLLAQDLTRKNYEVYYFKSASALSLEIDRALDDMLECN